MQWEMNRGMIMRDEITSCPGERGRLHERWDFGQLVAGRGRGPRPSGSGLHSASWSSGFLWERSAHLDLKMQQPLAISLKQ